MGELNLCFCTMAINEFYLLKVRDLTMPNLLQYVTIKRSSYSIASCISNQSNVFLYFLCISGLQIFLNKIPYCYTVNFIKGG